MQETECASGGNFSSKLIQKNQSSNIYMSPAADAAAEAESRGTVGAALRTLPRLSASEAVQNFYEIGADRQHGKGQYRHVSHADFHKSQEMGNKKREITSEVGNAVDDSQRLLTSSHQDPSM